MLRFRCGVECLCGGGPNCAPATEAQCRAVRCPACLFFALAFCWLAGRWSSLDRFPMLSLLCCLPVTSLRGELQEEEQRKSPVPGGSTFLPSAPAPRPRESGERVQRDPPFLNPFWHQAITAGRSKALEQCCCGSSSHHGLPWPPPSPPAQAGAMNDERDRDHTALISTWHWAAGQHPNLRLDSHLHQSRRAAESK